MNIVEKGLTYFFPKKCVFCGELIKNDYELVCSNDLNTVMPIKNIKGAKCKKCCDFLFNAREKICYSCSEGLFVFGKNVSIYYYENHLIKNLIHMFKFDKRKSAGRDIARFIEKSLKEEISLLIPDVIIPVPLSKKSKRQRGYNQVEYILNRCNIEYINVLKRAKHDTSQSMLSYTDRRENIKGQFEIIKSMENIVKDKRILVIDDIFTTGSTINEISKVLLEAGASEVDSLTFFRASFIF